jgi:hypothetical protein
MQGIVEHFKPKGPIRMAGSAALFRLGAHATAWDGGSQATPNDQRGRSIPAVHTGFRCTPVIQLGGAMGNGAEIGRSS